RVLKLSTTCDSRRFCLTKTPYREIAVHTCPQGPAARALTPQHCRYKGEFSRAINSTFRARQPVHTSAFEKQRSAIMDLSRRRGCAPACGRGNWTDSHDFPAIFTGRPPIF